jgi:hypothetical protein
MPSKLAKAEQTYGAAGVNAEELYADGYTSSGRNSETSSALA